MCLNGNFLLCSAPGHPSCTRSCPAEVTLVPVPLAALSFAQLQLFVTRPMGANTGIFPLGRGRLSALADKVEIAVDSDRWSSLFRSGGLPSMWSVWVSIALAAKLLSVLTECCLDSHRSDSVQGVIQKSARRISIKNI